MYVTLNLKKHLTPKNLFSFFLALHILIWTLVPLYTRVSLHHDVLEGISQGMSFQLGYSKHPFLSMWIVASVWKYIGEHDWIMYLLSQCVMVIAFLYIWKLNHALLSPWKALIATLFADGLLVFNINANILTPDTFQIPCWTAIGYYLYKLSWSPTRKNFMRLGFLYGLGALIKYQIIVLFVPGFLFFYSIPHLRKHLFSSAFLWGVLVFLITFSPHIYWMIKTHFANFDYLYKVVVNAPKQNREALLLEFLGDTLAFCLPVLVMFVLTFLAAKTKKKTMSSQNQYLIICLAWGPWLMTFLWLMLFKGNMYSRWMSPYFSFLGTFLLSVVPLQLEVKHLYRFAGVFVTGTALLVSINIFKPVYNPHCDAFYPNKEIAQFIENTWKKEVHQRLFYVGGSRYLVAAITPYIHPSPKPFFSLDVKTNPWIQDTQLREKGAVMVWDIHSNYAWDQETLKYSQPPENLKGMYPFIKELKSHIFYTSRQQPIEIAYAILMPEVAQGFSTDLSTENVSKSK